MLASTEGVPKVDSLVKNTFSEYGQGIYSFIHSQVEISLVLLVLLLIVLYFAAYNIYTEYGYYRCGQRLFRTFFGGGVTKLFSTGNLIMAGFLFLAVILGFISYWLGIMTLVNLKLVSDNNAAYLWMKPITEYVFSISL